MVQGRDKEAVYAFFRSMGKTWCEAVEIVTADLWRAYKTAIRKFLPNAKIVTDKFHVCKYAADALDEVRRSEYGRQADKTDFDLKEQVFTFYEHATREDAEAFLRNWSSACIASELPAFVKLGRRLLRNAESILAYTGYLKPYPAPNVFCDD